MGMDVAPNPNPLDTRISMDIHAHKISVAFHQYFTCVSAIIS
jgi:hypothetical protein